MFSYAAELERLGLLERAIAEYTELVDARSGGVAPLLRRADLLRQVGRVAEAEVDLVEAELWDATELEEAGRYEDAIAAYESLAVAGLGGSLALIRRSELEWRLGWDLKAEAGFRVAAAAAPQDGRPLLRLAQIAACSDRRWLAGYRIEEAIKREPEVPEYRVAAVDIFVALGWFDRAASVVRGLPSGLPGGWDAVREQAVGSRGPLDHFRAEARARLRSFVRQADQILPAFELAMVLFFVGRVGAAVRLCECVMRDRPHSFPAFELYAKILARRDGLPQAVQFLRAVAFLHDDKPEYQRLTTAMAAEADAL